MNANWISGGWKSGGTEGKEKSKVLTETEKAAVCPRRVEGGLGADSQRIQPCSIMLDYSSTSSSILAGDDLPENV